MTSASSAVPPTADTWLHSLTPTFPDRYRTLLHHLPQAFCLVEALFDEQGRATDYRFLEVNFAFVQQTDLRDAVGRTLRELVPEPQADWYELVGHVARTGQAAHVEQQARHLGERWFEVHALPSGPPGSHQVALLCTDITARKHDERRRQFLLQLSDALRPLGDATAVERETTRLLGEALGANRVFFALIEADEQAGSIRSDYTVGIPSGVGRYVLSTFAPEFMPDWRAGRTTHSTDVNTDPRFTDAQRAAYASVSTRAAVGVPLVKAGRLVALLGVNHAAPRQWTREDISLLQEVAERTWAAVERARAEEALRQSEEQLRLFVTASSEAVYKMSADWQCLLQLQGKRFLADTTAPSATWLDGYIPPADQPAVRAAIQAAIAERRFFELEHRVIRADGSPGWTFSRAAPLLDAQGELVEWFGTATDITARKQAQQQLQELAASLERQIAERTQALQESYDLLHSVFDTSLTAMTVLAAVRDEAGQVQDFRINLVNRELEREAGRTDLVGKHYAAEYPGMRQMGIFDLMLRALASGEPQSIEYHYAHEGFDAWYLTQYVKLGDGLVGSNLNITARKQAEAANIRLHLTQQQALFEAVQSGQEEERRRIAESLHDGLGQVLFATKIQLDRLPPLPEHPARQEAARLLGDAIRQARALSHELSPALLDEFGLQKALAVICQQLLAPGLRWQCYVELDEASPLPRTLQLAVYRLAQTLAHNVAQHARASLATLEMEVLPRWVVLRVEDNGCGFDPATVHEGLGLKTLRSRTTLLGGVVQLDSAPGQGTQVLVRLPLP